MGLSWRLPVSRRLVIFDADGTLVDTVEDVAECFNQALVAAGYPSSTLEGVAAQLGKPLEEIVRGILPPSARGEDAAVAAVSKAYRQAYAASPKSRTRPYPGVSEALRKLVDSGMRIAVNSNKPHDNLVRLMDGFFGDLPLLVCGYGNVGIKSAKPDPEGARWLMAEAKVPPAETLYVGDTHIDVDTASNAGVSCVVVAWGQGTDELYRDPRIERVVTDTDELIAACGR